MYTLIRLGTDAAFAEAIFIPSYEAIVAALQVPAGSPFTSSSSLSSSIDSTAEDETHLQNVQSTPPVKLIKPSEILESSKPLNVAPIPEVPLELDPQDSQPATPTSTNNTYSNTQNTNTNTEYTQHANNFPPDDGQLVKDLMRGQGALEALTQTTATPGTITASSFSHIFTLF